MKAEQFTTIILESEEGYYLTQASDVDIKDRLVASVVALGKYDSVDNYKEITQEEGDAIKAEQDKLFKEEANEGNKE